MEATDGLPKDWHTWRRFQALRLNREGWYQRRIAMALGVSEVSVSHSCTRAAVEGPGALLPHPSPGCPPDLSPDQLRMVPEFLWHGAEAYGFRGQVWTCGRVARMIEREFGVSYDEGHVSRLRKHLRWTPQTPISRATQRDEAAIERWRSEVWNDLQNLRPPAIILSPTSREREGFCRYEGFMAKARAIVKRRKAVRNIRKITKTMQMIATAKFQKSLKRAVGTKPYTLKVRELVGELASSIGDVEHPLLRRPEESGRTHRVAVVVITSNRGLAGAYNGNVLRTATAAMREYEAQGNSIDLYVGGKKGVGYYNFQKRPISRRVDVSDTPRFSEVEPLANQFMDLFTSGKVDAVYVAYMNFQSAGVQKPDVMQLLPLGTLPKSGTHDPNVPIREQAVYEFSPDPKSLLDELLPLTVRSALFQAFLDATTSEHVARMVAMKSATDNADKMVKALTMKYNRARQSQITTELAEIMGGVEAMKG